MKSKLQNFLLSIKVLKFTGKNIMFINRLNPITYIVLPLTISFFILKRDSCGMIDFLMFYKQKV
jgi:hypothetical protein